MTISAKKHSYPTRVAMPINLSQNANASDRAGRSRRQVKFYISGRQPVVR